MSSTIKLEIVTPDRSVLSEEVEYVGVPGTVGQFGVMQNHIPLLSSLAIGCLYYRSAETQNKYIFVSGGFAEVSPESITILAESAEQADEIDPERAKRAKERAEKRLQQQQEDINRARAEAALYRSLLRLNTVEKETGKSYTQ